MSLLIPLSILNRTKPSTHYTTWTAVYRLGPRRSEGPCTTTSIDCPRETKPGRVRPWPLYDIDPAQFGGVGGDGTTLSLAGCEGRGGWCGAEVGAYAQPNWWWHNVTGMDWVEFYQEWAGSVPCQEWKVVRRWRWWLWVEVYTLFGQVTPFE